MKCPSSLLILVLLLSASASALVLGKTQQPGAQQNSATSKPDLIEAERLNASVISLYNEHKLAEAFPIAKRVLEIREKALAAGDELIVAALINLAEIQLARGKHPEAQEFFESALKSVEKTYGPDGLQVAKLLDRLAIVNYNNGNPGNTESYYKRALAIREKALGTEHADVAHSIYNLAEFFQFQGNYKAAEPLYQRLIEIRNKNAEKEPEPLEEARSRYACLLRKTKRQNEADQLEGLTYSAARVNGVPPTKIVPAGIINGKAITLVTPPFPAEARGKQSGKVTVRVLIDENGRVLRACAVEGPNLLMKVSESAAYRSKFTPTKLEGMPVKVNGVIIYNFVSQ
jgi:tetratricopeptide (TPR) repeat protein